MKDIHSQMFEDFEKGATIVVSQQGKKTKKIVRNIFFSDFYFEFQVNHVNNLIIN